MNKSDLVAAMTTRFDGDRQAAARAVNGVLEEIEQGVARGEKVSLSGFGTFDRRERGPRTARNPATGEQVQVGASVAPVFRAGTRFRQVLTGGNGTGSGTSHAAASPAKQTVSSAADDNAPRKKAAAKGQSKNADKGRRADKKAGKKERKANKKK